MTAEVLAEAIVHSEDAMGAAGAGSSSAVPVLAAGNVTTDMLLSVNATHDFVTQFLPTFLLVFLILLTGVLVAWTWTTLWSWALWQCGVPDHWRRLTTYLWAITLVTVGVAAALTAVGVDVGHVFIGLGLLGIAVSAGMSSTIANVFSGIMLQTHGLFANHQTVILRSYGDLTGTITAMNLLHVTINEKPKDKLVERTVLVPNTVVTDTPVEVVWKEGSAPSRQQPSGLAMATPRAFYAFAEAARRDDVPPRTTTRLHAHPSPEPANIAELARVRLQEQRQRRSVAKADGEAWKFTA